MGLAGSGLRNEHRKYAYLTQNTRRHLRRILRCFADEDVRLERFADQWPEPILRKVREGIEQDRAKLKAELDELTKDG